MARSGYVSPRRLPPAGRGAVTRVKTVRNIPSRPVSLRGDERSSLPQLQSTPSPIRRVVEASPRTANDFRRPPPPPPPPPPPAPAPGPVVAAGGPQCRRNDE